MAWAAHEGIMGMNVLTNAGSPLLAFIFSPVTWLFGPVAAFNLASTVALPLSATACYVLIRRFTHWRPAAFIGGLLYGFSPQELAHAGSHLNLSFAPLVPLILLALYELVNSAAVVFPFPSGVFPEPVLWQAEARLLFKMPGGSFFVPRGPSSRVAFSPTLGYTRDSITARVLTNLAKGMPSLQSITLRRQILAQWRSWHVATVVAVPSASVNPRQSTEFLSWLLGPPSAETGGALVWYKLR